MLHYYIATLFLSCHDGWQQATLHNHSIQCIQSSIQSWRKVLKVNNINFLLYKIMVIDAWKMEMHLRSMIWKITWNRRNFSHWWVRLCFPFFRWSSSTQSMKDWCNKSLTVRFCLHFLGDLPNQWRFNLSCNIHRCSIC